MTSKHSGILSANDLALLATAAPDLDGTQLADQVVAPGFSWDRALDLAASNRVVCAATEAVLSKTVAPHLDVTLRARWLALRDAARERAQRAARELRCAVEAMERHGVVPFLYKGLDFDALCYPPGVSRSFNDIDIIVRPDQAEAAAAALYAEGYDLPPRTPSLDYFRRFHLHAIFLDRDRLRLPIELHWALDSPHSAAPDVVPLILEKATRDPEFAGVLRPDAVDALALMAGHLDKHLGLSAWLPTREARLESVIEDHGLVWLLDVVLWMRAFGAQMDGEAVQERMQELCAQGGITTSLRLALDLDPTALPAWAVAVGERLPESPPLIVRVMYKDLCANGPPTERGRRLRDWSFHTLPEVGFAPVSALQALLPTPRIPGTSPRSSAGRLKRIPPRLGLLIANVIAVIRWRFDRWRSERAGAGAAPGGGVGSNQPSE
jgi:hypothetical protein